MKTVRILLFVPAFFSICTILQGWFDPSGVRQAWVARYDAEYRSKSDEAVAIAIDQEGNICVTGKSYDIDTKDDYATVKYDPKGNELWSARYDGPSNSYEIVRDIAVDSDGNVCVTGRTSYDYCTVKYDPNGNELWVATYDSPVLDWDEAQAIAIDTAGNIYVTGTSDMDSSKEHIDDHYITIKYSPDGDELWLADYTMPDGLYDFARDIEVDIDGNVYVTGESDGWTTGYDFATVKYDTGGTELWVARYTGTGETTEGATALAIDPEGNVYVTGHSEDISGGFTYDWSDFATIKYDTDGNELWTAHYDGPGDDVDEARAIAVDDLGNVYVTGESIGDGTGNDFATVKYSTSGTELWVARYDGPDGDDDFPTGVAVDDGGTVYVTGKSRSGESSYDFVTIAYDSDGNELWVQRYDGPSGVSDEAGAVAVDDEGNAVVTGFSTYPETGRDFTTIKYDCSGNEMWVSGYYNDEYVWSGTDRAGDFAMDTEGNIIVTGTSSGNDTGTDIATVKYSASGHEIWSARYAGEKNDEANAVAVDDSGNIFVTGYSKRSGETNGDDYITLKYDGDGLLLWASTYSGPGNGSVYQDVATALALDGDGNVYVTGHSRGSSRDDYVTIKYDRDGNEMWMSRYDSPGGESDRALALDVSGNVYVTGSAGTVAYDTDGNELWTDDPGGTCYDIIVDGAGDVYTTGSSHTVKYDSDGNKLWTVSPPGSYYAVALDDDAYVCITGTSGDDYSTICYDAWGNEIWTASYDGPDGGDDIANDLAFDAQGYVYVTGRSIHNSPYYDYATVKYSREGTAVWAMRYDGSANEYDRAVKILVDGCRNVFVTGYSTDTDTRSDYTTIKYIQEPGHYHTPAQR